MRPWWSTRIQIRFHFFSYACRCLTHIIWGQWFYFVKDLYSLRTAQCHRFSHPESRELAHEWRAVDTGHSNVSISRTELITGDSAHFRRETRPTFAILSHNMYRTAMCNEINAWFSLRSSVHSSYEFQAWQVVFAASCTSVWPGVLIFTR